jgi:hypothetical protein
VYGIPSILGYNPLDVARYRQFLAFSQHIGDRQTAFAGRFTQPVTTELNLRDPRFFDLLGVRYDVYPIPPALGFFQPQKGILSDPAPRSYDFLIGMQNLSPQYLFENMGVSPRAFIVTHIVSQEASEPEILHQLMLVELRQSALVEPGESGLPNLPTINHPPGPARIRSHSPNEIRIDLDGRTAGLLVLTDPWYPGWVCRVDGQEVPIWKADYAFRGVMVPEGSLEVVFHFEPKSYRRGRVISLATLFFVSGLLLASLVRRRFTSSTGSQSSGR